MTAAGIATLYITQDYLHGNEGIECHGNVTNLAIEAGHHRLNVFVVAADHLAQVFQIEP